MSIRKVPFVAGEFYHLYNRGNGKQKIFHDKEDYSIFMKYLFLFNQTERTQLRDSSAPFKKQKSEQLVAIGAYVLMPNHFHILVTEKVEGGVSKFMQKVSTGYVMYYNQKYARTGSLFEGKFKSKHLDTDRYLKYIFSYIHLNPVKLIDKDWKEKGIRNKRSALDFLIKYRYSSYLDYTGTSRSENCILNREDFPNYFPSEKSFNEEILSWFTEARPQ